MILQLMISVFSSGCRVISSVCVCLCRATEGEWQIAMGNGGGERGPESEKKRVKATEKEKAGPATPGLGMEIPLRYHGHTTTLYRTSR